MEVKPDLQISAKNVPASKTGFCWLSVHQERHLYVSKRAFETPSLGLQEDVAAWKAPALPARSAPGLRLTTSSQARCPDSGGFSRPQGQGGPSRRRRGDTPGRPPSEKAVSMTRQKQNTTESLRGEARASC